VVPIGQTPANQAMTPMNPMPIAGQG